MKRGRGKGEREMKDDRKQEKKEGGGGGGEGGGEGAMVCEIIAVTRLF